MKLKNPPLMRVIRVSPDFKELLREVRKKIAEELKVPEVSIPNTLVTKKIADLARLGMSINKKLLSEKYLNFAIL